MWSTIARITAINLIPKAIEVGIDAATKIFYNEEPKPKPVKKRTCDTHKFSQVEVNYICRIHQDYKEGRTSFKTQKDLANYLNEHFNLDKSLSSYSRVWSYNENN